MVLFLSTTITSYADSYTYDCLNDCNDEYYGRFRGQGMSISVYNWGEYISDGSDELIDVCAAFEELTGIKVFYTNFATNEEMYAKIKSGGSSYDVIIPSDYMIGRMIKEKMLLPLDYDNIPNSAYIDQTLMNPQYDPGAIYSIPYTWSTVAIIYNTKLVDTPPTSWNALWDEEYSKQILMFANSRDAFGIALKYLGYSLNTENPEELREATDLLIKQKPLVQAYVMDQIFDKMENNEAALAPYYAGDAIQMLESNENLAVAFPKEGTNIFVDAACIPACATNKIGGEMFINFLNEPAVAAENIEYIGYGTPNQEAFKLLPQEVQESEISYPSQAVINNSEAFVNLSEETNLLIDAMWTEVLSSQESVYSWALPPIIVILAIIIGKAIHKQRKKARHKKIIED